jgi:uncharacterized FAD-dependent dehydrogenase
MGYKELEIRVPVQFSEDEIKKHIRKISKLTDFNFQILRKSLDARNKKHICWQYRVGVSSDELKHGAEPVFEFIEIPHKNSKHKVVIVGSGPAGIFAGLLLAEAGIKVTIIERGSKVAKRRHSIEHFERTQDFDPKNNYAFGEGGAGTFSDGKLTSRTKGISKERNYIYHCFVEAGAPSEIVYMTHPHLGSDNLFSITSNLRAKFEALGGTFLFDTLVQNITIQDNKVVKVLTSKGDLDADFVVFATGHSATETFRMLISKGVPFQTKNFAIGMRAEHHQELINNAQWGVSRLPGVKAAEYRLTASIDQQPFYSFCMCPGGIVVPATAYANSNIVNGMSLYRRNGRFANAAVVAGINLNALLGREISVSEAIDWLEKLEQGFFTVSENFNAPSIKIADFMLGKTTQSFPNRVIRLV